ncbi:hypothetical protein [Flavobacterium daejeonense]|uniref:hypothetical protein n=1 Tax=Flavobacterium daejeonense TaxID=350893 RepID=UPI00047CD81C|nr:hypothetical protein [Flavobacterium daejeonense]
MKKKIYLLVIIICAAFSCISKEKNNQPENLKFLNTKDNVKLFSNLVDTLVIYDDSFIFRTLENTFNITNISSVYSGVVPTQQFVPNAMNTSIQDTLITYNTSTDKIVFHKGGGNTILEEAKIESQTLVVDNNLQIGISKSLFEQKFNKNSIPDICVVKDTEGGNSFVFTFSQNQLQNISFSVTYF